MATKAQQTLVNRWVRKWKKRLLLAAWTVEIVYQDDPHDEDTDTDYTKASALPYDKYRKIVIALYPSFWEAPVEDQEQTLMHELAHAITNYTNYLILRRVMQQRVTMDEAAYANEQLTEHITKIMWDAYN